MRARQSTIFEKDSTLNSSSTYLSTNVGANLNLVWELLERSSHGSGTEAAVALALATATAAL